ncbi:hypothetical protein KQI42_14945 [Tissierella sp. MSJ-40]|uniref:Uncharacterized protein n=1 Tax=Tissierella simiarum TaxID=2841534 RepID=A0ABS6E8S5_9FIRM|nr:hypothetical protein [Tissierella simiarum]MBU5439319.1 hypothetical protein [Tissierella simiarum]
MNKHKTTKKKFNPKTFKAPKPSKPQKQNKEFPIPEEELEKIKALSDQKLVFSFRFLELNHEAFNLGGTCNRWGNDLFNLFNQLSKITRNEFVNELREHYRSHTHCWDELDYKYNFDDDFLEQIECRQARISTSKGGIHGFIIGNRFYIVWLDPHHNLYPSERHGGLKIFQHPNTCCGDRELEIQELKSRIKEYEELLEITTCPN